MFASVIPKDWTESCFQSAAAVRQELIHFSRVRCRRWSAVWSPLWLWLSWLVWLTNWFSFCCFWIMSPPDTTPHLIWEQPHIRTSSFFRYLQDFTGTRLSARAALKNNKSYFQTCRATNTLQHRSQGWLFISLSNYKVAHERTYICF